MRIPVGQRLFWTVLAVTTLIIVTVIGATSFNLRHGLAGYISAAQLSFMNEFAGNLEGIYKSEGGWTKLASDPARWSAMVEKAIQDIEDRRRAGHLPAHRESGTRPPPYDRTNQGDRMSLSDATGHLLAGNPGGPVDGSASRPLIQNGVIVGYLNVAAPSLPNELDEYFLRGVMRSLMLIATTGLALSALAAFFLARNFGNPISLLRDGAQRLASGDYGARIALRRRDEFGDLVRDFNRLGEALGRQEGSRRQWVADTSHELRTPITVLRAQIEAMRDKVFNADERSLARLHGQVLALGKLVDDLHELARADAGGLALRREHLDPMEIADQVIADFASRLHAAGAKIEFSPPAGKSAAVFADPDRLRQLFTNILENSMRHSDRPARLHVSSETRGGLTTITFEDSPPGVPLQDCEKLFDRFYRVDDSRNRETAGSGLGLSICKSIVEVHGGSISAKPSALGGLRIDVSLPLESAAP